MAVKHNALLALEATLEGIDSTFTHHVGESVWVLRVLSTTETNRARSLVKAENILEAFADSNVPQLAYAVVSVDGTPLSELFEPDSKEEREVYEEDPKLWAVRQMADWIGGLPTNVMQTMWMKYLDAKERIDQSLHEMRNLSKKTPTGA